MEKVRRDFSAAVRQPAAVEFLNNILIEPAGTTAAEFQELIRDDAARWERVVRAINLNPQQR
jgi:tripartite-type tricarboxylate transporter receptor subunit TctC